MRPNVLFMQAGKLFLDAISYRQITSGHSLPVLFGEDGVGQLAARHGQHLAAEFSCQRREARVTPVSRQQREKRGCPSPSPRR